MSVDVNQDCRISVPIFVLLLWQQWSFTFVFLEHNSISLKIPHFFLAHTSSCMEMICGYLDVRFIHLVCMKFTNFYNSLSYGLY